MCEASGIGQRTTGLDFCLSARCEPPLWGNCAAARRHRHLSYQMQRQKRGTRIRLLCPAVREFAGLVLLRLA